MTFVKGVCANPKGRPKGSKNRQTTGLLEQIQARVAEDYGTTGWDPVVQMAVWANDPNNPMDLRFGATREVAKYVRPVLKAVEVSGNVDVNVEQKYDATDKLLAALEAMASAKKSGQAPVLEHAPVVPISDMKRHEGPEAPVLVVLDAVEEAVLADDGEDEADGDD